MLLRERWKEAKGRSERSAGTPEAGTAAAVGKERVLLLGACCGNWVFNFPKKGPGVTRS